MNRQRKLWIGVVALGFGLTGQLALGADAGPAERSYKLDPGVVRKMPPQIQPKRLHELKPATPTIQLDPDVARKIRPQHQLPLPHGSIVLPRTGCPDPAVELVVRRYGRNDDGSYWFRVMAEITNLGNGTFQARRTQTGISIKEGGATRLSKNWGTVVGSDITLRPGHKTRSSYKVNAWNPTSEFAADFTAALSYDPDMAIDGNPNSRDCNRSNNRTVLRKAELVRILAR